MQFLFWRLDRYATFEHRCDSAIGMGRRRGSWAAKGTEPQDTSRQTTFDLPFQDCAWCQHCQCMFALYLPAISPAYLVRQEKSQLARRMVQLSSSARRVLPIPGHCLIDRKTYPWNMAREL